MKKLVSLLTVFALVLLSACAWWSEPDPDNMRDETLWALSSPETLQTVFPDTAATGEEQDGLLPLRQMIVDVADICIGDLRNVHHARAVFRQGDECAEFCDGLDLALE